MAKNTLGLKTILFIFSLGLMSVHPVNAQNIVYVNQNTTCNTGCDGSTWNQAYPELWQALNAVNAVASPQSPYQVWVAEGTYKPEPALGRSGSFEMKSNVEIYAGFEGNENEINYLG